jgi:hypothetical protein
MYFGPTDIEAATMANQVPLEAARPRARHWGVAVAAALIVGAVFAIGLQGPRVILTVPIQTALIFAPTFIAFARSHRNTTAIFVFNLLMFGGLSFATGKGDDLFQFAFYGAVAGTVITMVWSFVTDRG